MDSPSADHGHSDERASSNGAPVVDRRGQDAFAIGTFLASAPRRDRLGTSRRSIRPRVPDYLGRAIRCRDRTARKVGSGTHSGMVALAPVSYSVPPDDLPRLSGLQTLPDFRHGF